MEKIHESQSDKEKGERPDFVELVNVCREIKEKELLNLPTNVVENERGIFEERFKEELSADVREVALQELTAFISLYNKLRYILSSSFDLEADNWNSQPIGKVLKTTAIDLHEYTGLIERDTPFDLSHLAHIYDSIESLVELCASEEYVKANTAQRLEMLNNGAELYDQERRAIHHLRMLSRQVQVVLTLYESLKKNPGKAYYEEVFEEFYSTEYVSKLTQALKTYCEAVAE